MAIGLLSFVHGWADALCLKQFNCFASMMTGNVITFFSAIGAINFSAGCVNGGMATLYVVGAVAYCALDGSTDFARRWAIIPALGAVPFVAHDAAFMLIDVSDGPFPIPLPVLLLPLGFGFFNAASARATGGVTTYMMTAHLHKIASGIGSCQPACQARTSALVVGSFAAGALVRSSVPVALEAMGVDLASTCEFSMIGLAVAALLLSQRASL